MYKQTWSQRSLQELSLVIIIELHKLESSDTSGRSFKSSNKHLKFVSQEVHLNYFFSFICRSASRTSRTCKEPAETCLATDFEVWS